MSLFYNSFQLLKTAELFFLHSARLLHDVIGDLIYCSLYRWGESLEWRSVGVNSSFVALIATESVSIDTAFN